MLLLQESCHANFLVEWGTMIAYCVSKMISMTWLLRHICHSGWGHYFFGSDFINGQFSLSGYWEHWFTWLYYGSASQTLLGITFHLGILFTWRFWFSRSEVEPKVRISNKSPRWGWWCYTLSDCKTGLSLKVKRHWAFSWPYPSHLIAQFWFSVLYYL